jgi:hypothetical protein
MEATFKLSRFDFCYLVQYYSTHWNICDLVLYFSSTVYYSTTDILKMMIYIYLKKVQSCIVSSQLDHFFSAFIHALAHAPHLVQRFYLFTFTCTIELHQPPVRLFAMPMNTAEPTRLSTGVEYRLQSIVEEMVSLAWPECGVSTNKSTPSSRHIRFA